MGITTGLLVELAFRNSISKERQFYSSLLELRYGCACCRDCTYIPELLAAAVF